MSHSASDSSTRESLRLSANSSSTDFPSRTGDRGCVHRTPEGNVHEELDVSPSTQRKQQDQHQERSTAWRYRIAAFERISRRLTWETRGLKIDAYDILICANTPHDLQQMLQKLADGSKNQGLKMNKSKIMVIMENDTPIYVKQKNKLVAAQTKMERCMLNITYRDRKINTWVRENRKVTYVIEQVRRWKWTWAGHVSRIRDNRWILRITTRKPCYNR